MKQALEALEGLQTWSNGWLKFTDEIQALRQALVDADDTSQKRVDEMVKTEHDRAVELGQAYERGWNAALAQREPVAWMHTTGTGHVYFRKKPQDKVFNPQPVFTSPPKREWVGLTDEEIQDLGYLSEKFDASNSEWFDRWGFARAIEAKLKEKNGGEYRNGATTERTRLKEKNQ